MSLRTQLAEVLGPDQVADGDSVLGEHARDLSYHPPHRRRRIFPESTEEVARVLEFADRERVPVVPFGAATSLEG